MILYHRTTVEAASGIRESGLWESREQGWVFFSTHRDGYADGYDAAVLAVDVPEHLAELDDEFQTGEQHYRVHVSTLRRLPVLEERVYVVRRQP